MTTAQESISEKLERLYKESTWLLGELMKEQGFESTAVKMVSQAATLLQHAGRAYPYRWLEQQILITSEASEYWHAAGSPGRGYNPLCGATALPDERINALTGIPTCPQCIELLRLKAEEKAAKSNEVLGGGGSGDERVGMPPLPVLYNCPHCGHKQDVQVGDWYRDGDYMDDMVWCHECAVWSNEVDWGIPTDNPMDGEEGGRWFDPDGGGADERDGQPPQNA